MTNIFSNSKRTHDKLYLNETKKVKETTKFLTQKIKLNNKEDIKILDVGCAAGSFLLHFSKEMPHAKLHGADVRDYLIKKANEICPQSEFYNIDIEEDTNDLRRNWTMLADGSRLTRNGLELISSLYLIECSKNH